MSIKETTDDHRAIETLIAQQLQNISWSADETSDWAAVAADFLPGAPLYAAARPAKSQTVAEFAERMTALSQGALPSFEQTMIGADVHVFGKVAIAFGACRNLENGSNEVRGVEAYLLVKESEGWRIAAQAWDTESEGTKLPAYLVAP